MTMDKKNYQIGNIKIVEFMGATKEVFKWHHKVGGNGQEILWQNCEIDNGVNGLNVEHHQLWIHKSWDALIPATKKVFNALQVIKDKCNDPNTKDIYTGAICSIETWLTEFDIERVWQSTLDGIYLIETGKPVWEK